MKSAFSKYAIGWGLALVLFNAITFVMPPEISGYDRFEEPRFWIGYGIVTVFMIAQLACSYFIFRSGNLTRVFYGLNLAKVSVSVLVSMTIAGVVCMAFEIIPDWLAAIVCAILLSVNVVAYLRAAAAVDVVENIDKAIKTKTMFIKMLSADAQVLHTKAQSDEMSALTHKVYEAIRYSDPMSNEALNAVEDKLEAQFDSFSIAVKANDYADAQKWCGEILSSVTERNAKCKILK